MSPRTQKKRLSKPIHSSSRQEGFNDDCTFQYRYRWSRHYGATTRFATVQRRIPGNAF